MANKKQAIQNPIIEPDKDSSTFIFALKGLIDLDSGKPAAMPLADNPHFKALQKVAKADLHNHGKLGLSIQSLRTIVKLDIPDPPERMDGLGGMFAWTNQMVRPNLADPGRLAAAYEAAALDSYADGVVELEMSFEVEDEGFFPSTDAYIRMAAGIVKSLSPRCVVRPEIGIKKQADLTQRGKILDAMISSGVFTSIDLYGGEAHPRYLSGFDGYFTRARERGLKIKAHVGEFEGFGRMKGLIDRYGVSALQHGISCAKSRRHIEWARSRDLAFNICPASNLALGAVRSLETHPIRRLYDAGLRVSVNTDDLLVFRSSISEQFVDLYRVGLFTAEELDRIRLMGLGEARRKIIK